MSTEIQKTESNLPANASSTQSTQEQILRSDIVLPKLMLMLALSDHVNARRAQAGDIVKNATGEKVGDEKTPIEFIPLTFQNLFMLSEDEKGKGNKADYKFRGYEDRTALNEGADWDFVQDGKPWKRTKVMNVYCLLPAELDKMAEAMRKFEETGEIDLETSVLPTVIQFRNSSFKAAKDVATLFVKAADLAARAGRDIPAYGSTMKLEVVPESSGDNDYYVMRVKPGGATKKEYLPECKRWREFLISLGKNVRVNESDVVEETVPF